MEMKARSKSATLIHLVEDFCAKCFYFYHLLDAILLLLQALGFEGHNLTPEKKKSLLLLLIVICSVCPLDISSSTYAHNV
jgi:hypothetical protein